MKAYEIIDRLARLDETPVEEPVVEPDVAPAGPDVDPGEPAPRHAPDPFELPPGFDPGALPRPKSEGGDESEAIGNWLEATQQPVQDWDWDGHDLRMLMDDGTTETYNRQQLDEIGIFSDEMAFAESTEEGGFDVSSLSSPKALTAPEAQSFNCTPVAASPDDTGEAAGVLDQILGRVGGCASCDNSSGIDPIVINIEGSAAEKLTQAVSDVISSILGKNNDSDDLEDTENSDDEGDSDGKKPKKASKAKSKPKSKKKETDSEDDEDDEDGEDDEDDDEE